MNTQRVPRHDGPSPFAVMSESKKYLTAADIKAEFGIPDSTWDKWRARRKTPPGRRLPNGELRFARPDVEAWFDSLEAA